jgi:hypothetical protein
MSSTSHNDQELELVKQIVKEGGITNGEAASEFASEALVNPVRKETGRRPPNHVRSFGRQQ